MHANKNFKLPEDPDTPIIMVGTNGIACRPFIEERIAAGAKEEMAFFGDRTQAHDYLYGEEWEGYRKDGILSELDLAWSRDQDEKVYDQHKMLERRAELGPGCRRGCLLRLQGCFPLAKDVDQALREIA